MRRRVEAPEPRPEHGNRRTPAVQAALMSGDIDAAGEAAHDDDRARREVPGEPIGDVTRVGCRGPRPDNGHGRPLERRRLAANPEHRGRIGNEREERRVPAIRDRNRHAGGGRGERGLRPARGPLDRGEVPGFRNAARAQDGAQQRIAGGRHRTLVPGAIADLAERSRDARSIAREHRDGDRIQQVGIPHAHGGLAFQALAPRSGGQMRRGRATAARAAGDRPLTSL